MDLYFKIKEQRDLIVAPVDYMGCHTMGENQEEDIKKFQILVGLLLSSQTKDQVTFTAIKNLNLKLGILKPLSVITASREDVHKCIEKVGYHNKKLAFLYSISRIVLNKMPSTLEETLALPGIGKKMAYLYLAQACNKNVGIGVDTHVHRISNRLGIVKSNNEENTRVQLEKIFSKEEWQPINKVLVGFGQVVCLPIKPKCSECCVSSVCPYLSKED